MQSIVIWRPEPLTAKLVASAIPARADFALAARARCKSKRVAASIRVFGEAVGTTDPVGSYLEHGTRAHDIAPKKAQALRFEGGGFAERVEHPGGTAQPFLRPTLPFWAGLYRRRAVGAFRV